MEQTLSKYEQRQCGNDQLLLAIPQAQLEIYPRYILLLFTQTPRKNTLTMDTIPSFLDQTNLKQKNIIMLSDNELVFNILEDILTVKISNIVTGQTVLIFEVSNLGTLYAVQSILRGKMCELGFQRRYSILKKLGHGASADVHLIERITDGKLFAVKIISIKNSKQKAYVRFAKQQQQTFINEVRLLRILKHKYIVKLQSVYYSKKCLYQVLEYLEGGTLLNQLRQRNIKTKQEQWRVISHITQAVEHMRQKMIVHRDLKLENILIRKNVDGSKDYVVSDFGLAAWIGQAHPIFQRCGTPGYIAPQILRAPKNICILSHKTDIFSLGVLYHFIFLNRSVFKFETTKQLMILNKKAQINFEKKMYQDLTFTQKNLLQNTLDADPQKRYNSAQLLQYYINYKQQSNHKNTNSTKKIHSVSNRSINKLQPRISIRTDLSSNNKVQIKETKQQFIKKSLSQSLSKLKQQKKKVQKQQKNQQYSKSFFQGFFSKINLGKGRQSILRKKKQETVRKRQMTQFL